MAFDGILRHFTAFYEIQLHFIDFNGIVWKFMSFMAFLWHFNGILWHFIAFLCNYMAFQDILWPIFTAVNVGKPINFRKTSLQVNWSISLILFCRY
jgi:hypothetical protein